MKRLLKLTTDFLNSLRSSEPSLPIHTYAKTIIGEWYCLSSCSAEASHYNSDEHSDYICIDNYSFNDNGTGIWSHLSNFDYQQFESFAYRIKADSLYTWNIHERTVRIYKIKVAPDYFILTSEYNHKWRFVRKRTNNLVTQSSI